MRRRSTLGRRYANLGARLLLLLVPGVYFLLAADAPARPGRATRHLLTSEPGNCTSPAIDDFPPDVFSPQQRRHGAVALHAVLACYLFVLLAQVCERYFVPSIKLMCNRLRMSESVAGATFMAAATSSPELFINGVGTFITEGDIGVGTVVGSAVFNILAVPACCGLFAGKVVALEPWPLTRDCAMYGLAVLLLIATLYDGVVHWYEALGLVILYAMYVAGMYFNKELGRFVRRCCRLQQPAEERTPLLAADPEQPNGKLEVDEELPLCSLPNHSLGSKIWWMFMLPISCMLSITIPDCRLKRWRHFYPLTFVMCMLWIGTASYMVAWMITVIGDTLDIPDSVMGLTFLAAGTSVPEAVSSVLVTNQGYGTMGISNSIGSNTFNILLCLGLPWLLKAVFMPVVPGQHFVDINSDGIIYSAMSLISTLILLYGSLGLNRFKLDRTIGIVTLLIYIGFLSLSSMIELNVFFTVNPPTCPH